MSRYYSFTGDTNTIEGQGRRLQRGLSVVFFLAATMLSTVLLFNLLIAMMVSTYEQVKERAFQRYVLTITIRWKRGDGDYRL